MPHLTFLVYTHDKENICTCTASCRGSAAGAEEETTLAAYLDGLTNLLLDNKLGSPKATYDANVVARAKTMVVLRRLHDPHRKAMVVQFLYEAHLITGKQSRISLVGVDLSGANLNNANLSGANLSGAHLNRALLRGTDLRGADLSSSDLRGADMREAMITVN